MIGPAGSVAACAILLGAAMAMTPAPAEAKTCATRKISATGTTAQFAILGRVAARSAWSSKVAADPRLGPPYSSWLRSRDRRLVCRKVERRHLCLAVALPCRPDGRFSAPAAATPAAPVTNPKQRPL